MFRLLNVIAPKPTEIAATTLKKGTTIQRTVFCDASVADKRLLKSSSLRATNRFSSVFGSNLTSWHHLKSRLQLFGNSRPDELVIMSVTCVGGEGPKDGALPTFGILTFATASVQDFKIHVLLSNMRIFFSSDGGILAVNSQYGLSGQVDGDSI